MSWWWPWGEADEVDPNKLPAEAPDVGITTNGESLYSSETDGCRDCGRLLAELDDGESMICSSAEPGVICSRCADSQPADVNGRDFKPVPGAQESLVR